MNRLNKPTAYAYRMPREAFEATRANYAEIQARLDTILVTRAAELARKDQDYGFVGQEQHVVTLLATALAALGDRSAVDELGIAY